jgi:hypothetical protein
MLRILSAALIAVALVGCGGGGFAPAKGQLIYPDGKPVNDLDGFNIVFEGKAPDGRSYSAMGTIDKEGKFTLFTNKPGDGAPVGNCRVLIEPKMIDSEREAPYPLDRKYRSFETSGLTYEIKADGNDIQFTVEPKKKK